MPSSSGLKTEAAGSSTMLLIIRQTTRCHVPEKSQSIFSMLQKFIFHMEIMWPMWHTV